MKNMSDFFKDKNSKEMESAIKKATDFANTKDGREVVEKLKHTMPKDKDALLNLLSQNPDILKAVEKFLNP